MKKIYSFIAVAMVSAMSFAQNNVTNGGFETWSEGTPTGWLITLGANGGSITQETAIVHGGTSSVKLTAPTGGGNNNVGYTDLAIQPGQTYTISYWYNDQDDNARFRHWGSFRSATGALPSAEQVAAFQPSVYNENTTGWQEVTVSGVAPANAVYLRVDFRVFQQSSTAQGGSVYLDDVVVTGQLSVRDNAIAGLKIYPNPVTNGTFYVDTDNSGATKEVAIFDVLGKQVVKTATDNAVNVSNLKTGIYMVKVTEAGKTATRKLVIK